MQLAHRWQDRNLTKLERALALIIVILVFGTFTRHILQMFARAEMSMVSTTIINLNSSLKYHAALAVMRGDYEKLSHMDGMNPIDEVQSLQDSHIEINKHIELIASTSIFPIFSRPLNYIGELQTPDPGLIEKGSWYFDTGDKTLNYRVNNAQYYFDGMEDDNIIRFKVSIEYSDKNANGQYDPEKDVFISIKVKNIHSDKNH